MGFKGTIINKQDGGLGGGVTADRTAVIVVGMTATAEVLNNKAYELLQIEDVEALKITALSDDTNKVLVHEHLNEVFRLSPETKVYMVTVPVATKVSDLKNLEPLKAAIRGIEGVNTIGVAGLAKDTDLSSAVTGAQLLVDSFAAEHIMIDSIIIEGLGSYIVGEVTAFPDLRSMASPNVSVVIAQDATVAGKATEYNGYAAVGSAIGMLMVRYVHENMGSVDVEKKPRNRKGTNDYSLSDAKTGKWLASQLSNGKKFSELSYADQTKLDELGYIYAGSFAGYGGIFFSGSHTATTMDSDYANIERNAVWNKAARVIRTVLIPRVRSKVEADPTTGFIKNTTITDWDGRIRAALEGMQAQGNVAEFDIYINPEQTAVSTTPFNVKVQLVADGIVHEFEVDLGFTTKK